jgi:hypothetical protein
MELSPLFWKKGTKAARAGSRFCWSIYWFSQSWVVCAANIIEKQQATGNIAYRFIYIVF